MFCLKYAKVMTYIGIVLYGLMAIGGIFVGIAGVSDFAAFGFTYAIMIALTLPMLFAQVHIYNHVMKDMKDAS